MLITTACAAVLALGQEPAPPPPKPDPARAAFDEVLQRYADAAALETQITLTQSFDHSLIDPSKADAEPSLIDVGTIGLAVAWARPLSGTMTIEGKVEFEIAGQKIEQVMNLGLIGDGEQVWMVEHTEKIIEGPSTLAEQDDPLSTLPPFTAFFAGKAEAPDGLKRAPDDEKHAGMTGWSWKHPVADATLWMRDGKPVEYRLQVRENGRVMQEHVFRVDSVTLHEKADPAKWAGELPKGYTRPDEVTGEPVEAEEPPSFEEKLLAVGADAPEVTLTGMDDQDFALSSLRGKTVLLNFWFYH